MPFAARAFSRILTLALCVLGCTGAANDSVMEGSLEIRWNEGVRTVDRHRLLGSNLCLWHEPEQVNDPALRTHVRRLAPSFLRIPGGSWSDEYFWNGHGVREGEQVDTSKRVNGQWNVDYSSYAPGFRVQGPGRTPSDYHGVLDVKTLHEYVRDQGAEAIVTVNAGTGTPEMAAEWVRWANLKNDYRVRYWEIGNELEGAWELGHFRPDGSPMDGPAYAERFVAFARAMKAVDPTIQVGGAVASNDRGGFTEDLLRLAGDAVDFVSFHTYPVEDSLASEAHIFARARSVGPAMRRFRDWIDTYQPDRANPIEIGITEWNMKVVEDRDSADLMIGLWTTIWVGEMMRAGVSFANQWDLLTRTPEGGHGAFLFEGKCLPKSQFWALLLWSRGMGNQLLAHELDGLENVYVYPTRSGSELRVMVVNTDRDQAARIRLAVPGFEPAKAAHAARLSHAEYLWNPYSHQPVWSHSPASREIPLGDPPLLEVPPFSAVAFRLLPNGSVAGTAPRPQPASPLRLELLLPDSAPEDLPVEGWVLVRDADGLPVADHIDAAGLVVDGPAIADRYAVRVREAAGRFFLPPTGAGPVTVRAQAGPLQVQQTVEILPVEERAQVYWRFEDPPKTWNAASSFPLAADDSVRPNQSVAAITLNRVEPNQDQDTLLAFEQLPPTLPRDRIGGVVFDIHASRELISPDKDTRIKVILQSASAHWMELGSLALDDAKGAWQSQTFRLPEPSYHGAMPGTYALRFQVSQPTPKKTPISGTIHFDNIGFLLR